VSAEEQRVVYNGKQLEDETLLSLAGVEDEATLYVLGRLLGGAKKRKKKTYTKPKKQKHKHKKIKLRVLKFYKVSGATLQHHTFLCAQSRVSRARRLAPMLSLRCSPPVCVCVQVDDSGKVQRLRKQCPNCGAGTFMATHFDRVYCGKCSTTFLYEKGQA
jgi:ubiquitin-small subunit ribosomal protein S27Ae